MPVTTRRAVATAAGGVLALALAALPDIALGDSGDGYAGAAHAAGVRMTYKHTSDPLGTVYEGSAPIATARVTTDPDSQAFASAPYPGDDVMSQLNTFTAGRVPQQPYPASARSGVPGNPKDERSAPGYVLTAQSAATSSKGSASTGPGSTGDARVGSSVSVAEVKGGDDGGVKAVGRTATDSFSTGPLSVSRVTSEATAVLSADGTLTTSSKMELGDITISGQQVGLTKDGLTVVGTKVPLPSGQLTEALKTAGITVSYLAEEKSDEGVTAPGVLITRTDDQQAVSFTLGRAGASAVRTADGLGATDQVVVDIAPDASSDASEASAVGSDGSIPADSGSTQDTGTAFAPLDAPVSDVRGGMPATAPVAAPAAETVNRASPELQTFAGASLFYLVFVLAAVAALVLGQLMRYLGVRWDSSS